MDVEVVLDQDDGLGLGEVDIGQVFQDVSIIQRSVSGPRHTRRGSHAREETLKNFGSKGQK